MNKDVKATYFYMLYKDIMCYKHEDLHIIREYSVVSYTRETILCFDSLNGDRISVFTVEDG